MSTCSEQSQLQTQHPKHLYVEWSKPVACIYSITQCDLKHVALFTADAVSGRVGQTGPSYDSWAQHTCGNTVQAFYSAMHYSCHENPAVANPPPPTLMWPRHLRLIPRPNAASNPCLCGRTISKPRAGLCWCPRRHRYCALLSDHPLC